MIRALAAVAAACGLTACVYYQPEPPPTEEVRAVGYASEAAYAGMPAAQRRLMAMRASKVDAYRALAEAVYGVEVSGHTTVRDRAVREDRYRTYVDAVIRGARVVETETRADGIHATTVALDVGVGPWGCAGATGYACTEVTVPGGAYYLAPMPGYPPVPPAGGRPCVSGGPVGSCWESGYPAVYDYE